MKPPWILIDSSYLAYRAFFSMGELSHGDIPTGVVFGFLREVLQLQDHFGTTRIAFCFDVGRSVRREVYPSYKLRRNEDKTPEQKRQHTLVREQLTALRTDYLPSIGFSNIFYQKGYEADDIIASIVNSLKLTIAFGRPERAIIVSSDGDMNQLLSKFVSIWNPKKQELVTNKSFEKEWGLDPGLWPSVKAIAGCHTDEVEGIKGVGEKTAACFVKGTLKTGKKFDSIVYGNKVIRRNMKLVTIPYPGTKNFKLVKESVGQRGWAKLAKRLGMKHLFDNVAERPKTNRGFDRSEL